MYLYILFYLKIFFFNIFHFFYAEDLGRGGRRNSFFGNVSDQIIFVFSQFSLVLNMNSENEMIEIK